MGYYIEVNETRIGQGYPTYFVAELSANHNQSYEQAVKLVRAAKAAGANAIKLQTYTPETLTIDCDTEPFRIPDGNTWGGQTLYQLYQKAYTPWEWQPKLKKLANDLGLECFSSPFDHNAVDFLAKMDVPAYKIASFELVDLPLIKYIAQQGKPIIMSTGLSTLGEIDEALRTVREAGGKQVALLRCKSAYPALPEEMDLRTIPHMTDLFGLPVGLSDHTLGHALAIAAVSLGACIIEKHLTLSRSMPSPDSAFSIEPEEFKVMVENVRLVENALGRINYEPSEQELKNRVFRRSLFIIRDMKAGDEFTVNNVRSIRPGAGLAPRFLPDVLGCQASRDIARGTPLAWEHVKSN
jgi:N-acetylneuraminate synthase